MSAPSDRPTRVAITTLGCKVNFAEMATLAGELAAAGIDVVPEHENADFRVLNSCSVTAQADATTRQRLTRTQRTDPTSQVILTGCSVDANPGQYESSGSATYVVDNAHKTTIAEQIIALAALPSRPATNVGTTVPALRRARHFLKVQDGCDHRCTYCVVWRARGASTSDSAADVVARARAAVAAGHAEIVVTGVDLGSFGRGSDVGLGALVEQLAAAVWPAARIRLSSINANDFDASLIAAAAHPGVCAHLHIPLQSGSDAILKAMHRGYRRRQYMRVVETLRLARPETEITTDIISGFPGESDDDHAATLALMRDVDFLEAHVFRWSPRPGTPATDRGDRVAASIARERSAELRREAVLSGRRRYALAANRVHEVVAATIDHEAPRYVSSTYHSVVVDGSPELGPGIHRVLAANARDCELTATLLRP